MSKTLKIFAATFVAITGLLVLAGCTSYGREDAYLVPYSVIELEKPSWTTFHYGYVDNEGSVNEFEVCEKPGLFDQRVCSTEGLPIEFAFSRSDEGATTSASVTVSGVKYPMKCSVNKEDSWSGLDVCIPKSVEKTAAE